MSPDPANAGADLYNPQTWNGYSYVANSPLVYTDPSGKCFFCTLFGFLLAPETGGLSLIPTIIGAAVDTGILVGKTLSHGGGGHSGAGASTPATVSASGNAGSLPNGSFPGGETAGLPPGMSVPSPLSPQALLGLWDWNCAGSVCIPGAINDFQIGTTAAAARTEYQVDFANYALLRDILRNVSWHKVGGYVSCLAGANAADMVIVRNGSPFSQPQDSTDTPNMNLIGPQQLQYGYNNLRKNGGQQALNPSQRSPLPGNIAGGAAQAASTLQCIANVSNTW